MEQRRSQVPTPGASLGLGLAQVVPVDGPKSVKAVQIFSTLMRQLVGEIAKSFPSVYNLSDPSLDKVSKRWVGSSPSPSPAALAQEALLWRRFPRSSSWYSSSLHSIALVSEPVLRTAIQYLLDALKDTASSPAAAAGLSAASATHLALNRHPSSLSSSPASATAASSAASPSPANTPASAASSHASQAGGGGRVKGFSAISWGAAFFRSSVYSFNPADSKMCELLDAVYTQTLVDVMAMILRLYRSTDDLLSYQRTQIVLACFNSLTPKPTSRVNATVWAGIQEQITSQWAVILHRITPMDFPLVAEAIWSRLKGLQAERRMPYSDILALYRGLRYLRVPLEASTDVDLLANYLFAQTELVSTFSKKAVRAAQIVALDNIVRQINFANNSAVTAGTAPAGTAGLPHNHFLLRKRIVELYSASAKWAKTDEWYGPATNLATSILINSDPIFWTAHWDDFYAGRLLKGLGKVSTRPWCIRAIKRILRGSFVPPITSAWELHAPLTPNADSPHSSLDHGSPSAARLMAKLLNVEPLSVYIGWAPRGDEPHQDVVERSRRIADALFRQHPRRTASASGQWSRPEAADNINDLVEVLVQMSLTDLRHVVSSLLPFLLGDKLLVAELVLAALRTIRILLDPRFGFKALWISLPVNASEAPHYDDIVSLLQRSVNQYLPLVAAQAESTVGARILGESPLYLPVTHYKHPETVQAPPFADPDATAASSAYANPSLTTPLPTGVSTPSAGGTKSAKAASRRAAAASAAALVGGLTGEKSVISSSSAINAAAVLNLKAQDVIHVWLDSIHANPSQANALEAESRLKYLVSLKESKARELEFKSAWESSDGPDQTHTQKLWIDSYQELLECLPLVTIDPSQGMSVSSAKSPGKPATGTRGPSTSELITNNAMFIGRLLSHVVRPLALTASHTLQRLMLDLPHIRKPLVQHFLQMIPGTQNAVALHIYLAHLCHLVDIWTTAVTDEGTAAGPPPFLDRSYVVKTDALAMSYLCHPTSEIRGLSMQLVRSLRAAERVCRPESVANPGVAWARVADILEEARHSIAQRARHRFLVDAAYGVVEDVSITTATPILTISEAAQGGDLDFWSYYLVEIAHACLEAGAVSLIGELREILFRTLQVHYRDVASSAKTLDQGNIDTWKNYQTLLFALSGIPSVDMARVPLAVVRPGAAFSDPAPAVATQSMDESHPARMLEGVRERLKGYIGDLWKGLLSDSQAVRDGIVLAAGSVHWTCTETVMLSLDRWFAEEPALRAGSSKSAEKKRAAAAAAITRVFRTLSQGRHFDEAIKRSIPLQQVAIHFMHSVDVPVVTGSSSGLGSSASDSTLTPSKSASSSTFGRSLGRRAGSSASAVSSEFSRSTSSPLGAGGVNGGRRAYIYPTYYLDYAIFVRNVCKALSGPRNRAPTPAAPAPGTPGDGRGGASTLPPRRPRSLSTAPLSLSEIMVGGGAGAAGAPPATPSRDTQQAQGQTAETPSTPFRPPGFTSGPRDGSPSGAQQPMLEAAVAEHEWSVVERYRTFLYVKQFSGHGPSGVSSSTKESAHFQKFYLSKLPQGEREGANEEFVMVMKKLVHASHLAVATLMRMSKLVPKPEILSERSLVDWFVEAEQRGYSVLGPLLNFHVTDLLPTFVDNVYSSARHTPSLFFKALTTLACPDPAVQATRPPHSGIEEDTLAYLASLARQAMEGSEGGAHVSLAGVDGGGPAPRPSSSGSYGGPQLLSPATVGSSEAFASLLIANGGGLLHAGLYNLMSPEVDVRNAAFDMLVSLGATRVGQSGSLSSGDELRATLEPHRYAFSGDGLSTIKHHALFVSETLANHMGSFAQGLFREGVARIWSMWDRPSALWIMEMLAPWAAHIRLASSRSGELASSFSAEELNLDAIDTREPDVNLAAEAGTPTTVRSSGRFLRALFRVTLRYAPEPSHEILTLWVRLAEVGSGAAGGKPNHSNHDVMVAYILAQAGLSERRLATARAVMLYLYRAEPERTLQPLLAELTHGRWEEFRAISSSNAGSNAASPLSTGRASPTMPSWPASPQSVTSGGSNFTGGPGLTHQSSMTSVQSVRSPTASSGSRRGSLRKEGKSMSLSSLRGLLPTWGSGSRNGPKANGGGSASNRNRGISYPEASVGAGAFSLAGDRLSSRASVGSRASSDGRRSISSAATAGGAGELWGLGGSFTSRRHGPAVGPRWKLELLLDLVADSVKPVLPYLYAILNYALVGLDPSLPEDQDARKRLFVTLFTALHGITTSPSVLYEIKSLLVFLGESSLRLVWTDNTQKRGGAGGETLRGTTSGLKQSGLGAGSGLDGNMQGERRGRGLKPLILPEDLVGPRQLVPWFKAETDVGEFIRHVLGTVGERAPDLARQWGAEALEWAVGCTDYRTSVKAFQVFHNLMQPLDNTVVPRILGTMSSALASLSMRPQGFDEAGEVIGSGLSPSEMTLRQLRGALGVQESITLPYSQVTAALRTLQLISVELGRGGRLHCYPSLFAAAVVMLRCSGAKYFRLYQLGLELLDGLFTQPDHAIEAVDESGKEAERLAGLEFAPVPSILRLDDVSQLAPKDAVPFEGLLPLLLPGYMDIGTHKSTLGVLQTLALLPRSEIVDPSPSRLLTTMALLAPWMQLQLDAGSVRALPGEASGHGVSPAGFSGQLAAVLRAAVDEDLNGLADILDAYAAGAYDDSTEEFIPALAEELTLCYAPAWGVSRTTGGLPDLAVMVLTEGPGFYHETMLRLIGAVLDQPGAELYLDAFQDVVTIATGRAGRDSSPTVVALLANASAVSGMRGDSAQPIVELSMPMKLVIPPARSGMSLEAAASGLAAVAESAQVPYEPVLVNAHPLQPPTRNLAPIGNADQWAALKEEGSRISAAAAGGLTASDLYNNAMVQVPAGQAPEANIVPELARSGVGAGARGPPGPVPSIVVPGSENAPDVPPPPRRVVSPEELRDVPSDELGKVVLQGTDGPMVTPESHASAAQQRAAIAGVSPTSPLTRFGMPALRVDLAMTSTQKRQGPGAPPPNVDEVDLSTDRGTIGWRSDLPAAQAQKSADLAAAKAVGLHVRDDGTVELPANFHRDGEGEGLDSLEDLGGVDLSGERERGSGPRDSLGAASLQSKRQASSFLVSQVQPPSLSSILEDARLRRFFSGFVERNFDSDELAFYVGVREYSGEGDEEKAMLMSQLLIERFVKMESFHTIRIDRLTRNEILRNWEMCLPSRPPPTIFSRAAEEVKSKVLSGFYAAFLQSREYVEMIESGFLDFDVGVGGDDSLVGGVDGVALGGPDGLQMDEDM